MYYYIINLVYLVLIVYLAKQKENKFYFDYYFQGNT